MSPGTRAQPHTQSAQPEREHGIVIRRIDKKGFAFIRAESGTEYFFHLSDCVGDGTWNRLEEGTGVSFVATTTNKGPRAAFVKVR